MFFVAVLVFVLVLQRHFFICCYEIWLCCLAASHSIHVYWRYM